MNMYYPTGKTTKGRMVVCLCCEDIIPNSVKEMIPYKMGEYYAGTNEENQYDTPANAYEMECAIKEKLDEMGCCVESWQMEKAIKEAGFLDYSLQEMEGSPMASLATTSGMGSVQAPTFPGSTQDSSAGGLSPNAGFYSSSWQGSGDRFDAVGLKGLKRTKSTKSLPRKFKQVQDFKSFLSSKTRKK